MAEVTVLDFPQIEDLIENGKLYALDGTGLTRDKQLGAYGLKLKERRAFQRVFGFKNIISQESFTISGDADGKFTLSADIWVLLGYNFGAGVVPIIFKVPAFTARALDSGSITVGSTNYLRLSYAVDDGFTLNCSTSNPASSTAVIALISFTATGAPGSYVITPTNLYANGSAYTEVQRGWDGTAVTIKNILERIGAWIAAVIGKSTDFTNGNDGTVTSPTTVFGIVAKWLRDSQVHFSGRNRVISSTVSIPFEKSWTGTINTNTSTQWWNIAKIEANNSTLGVCWLRIRCATASANWYQDICVVMAGTAGPTIQVINATMRSSGPTYLPYYRVLYSNNNANAGCWLQIGVIDSGVNSRNITIDMGDNVALGINVLGWTDTTINASADGTPNLPDGTASGAADYTISTAVQGTMIGQPGAFLASAIGGASTGSLMSEAGKALFDNYKAALFALGVVGGTGTSEGEKSGKAVFDNYKAALFILGLAGGTGTTEGEKAGKSVYDKYREVAQFILGLGGGSGTSEAEKWGKEVYKKYGVDTDFPTGNAGTAGTNEIQGVGYEIYNNGLRAFNIRHKSQNNMWLQSDTQGSITVNTGAIRWFTIATTTADQNNSALAKFKIRSFADSYWYHEIEVSCHLTFAPKISVLYSNTIATLANYGKVPLFRCLYSSTDPSSGVVLQIGLQVDSNITNASINVSMEAMVGNISSFWTISDISQTVDGDANLPDGTTSAGGGYTIGDTVYGFGMGETEIWSGSQAIAASGNYNISSFFTGFSNQMFKRYRLKYSGGQFIRDTHIDINKPQISSNTSMAKNDGGGSTVLSLIIFPDGSPNAFNILNLDSTYGVTIFSLVGFT